MFYTEYELTKPRIHLVLNGGGALDEWNWENIPEHWLKRGMVSHGYQLNNERETEEKYMAQVMLICSSTLCAQARGDVDGYQIRLRGENAEDTTEDGWYESLEHTFDHPISPRLVAGGNSLEHDGPHGLACPLRPRLPRDQRALHQLPNATTRF